MTIQSTLYDDSPHTTENNMTDVFCRLEQGSNIQYLVLSVITSQMETQKIIVPVQAAEKAEIWSWKCLIMKPKFAGYDRK